MVISLHMPLVLKMPLLGSKSRVWEQRAIQSPRAQEPQRRCDPGEEASIPSQGKEEHVTREVPLLSLALSLLQNVHMAKSPRSQLAGLKNGLFPSTKAISSSCVCCRSRLPCTDTGNSILAPG